ncbi:MAG TPA: hypothetical protein V6C71_07095 [Coleofasciculaceae cyanobacterium]|jgi:hypothetical protein
MIRIGHNRRVRNYFKDVKSETSKNTRREAIKTSLLVRDEDSAIETLNNMTYFANYLEQENISSYPEGWEIKKGQDIPQLAIIYRDINKKSISGNYTLVIPHFKGTKALSITSYSKGDHWARWILKDNSQIVVNGSTQAEATGVIRRLERYVENKFQTKEVPWLKFGEYSRGIIKKIKVTPIRTDYYPEGKVNSLPEWRKYF